MCHRRFVAAYFSVRKFPLSGIWVHGDLLIGLIDLGKPFFIDAVQYSCLFLPNRASSHALKLPGSNAYGLLDVGLVPRTSKFYLTLEICQSCSSETNLTAVQDQAMIEMSFHRLRSRSIYAFNRNPGVHANQD